MTAKTVTMPVIVASGLAMLGAPDAGADVTSPLQALVDAAARRLQTADPVAASKFRTGGQVDDPQREQQVIDAVTADAALAHIDAGYVHNVFRNQIDATDSLEHSRFAQWKLDPASAPASAPDLSASRATIDTLNTPSSARSPNNGPHCIHRRAVPTSTPQSTPWHRQGISTPSTARPWPTQHTLTAGRAHPHHRQYERERQVRMPAARAPMAHIDSRCISGPKVIRVTPNSASSATDSLEALAAMLSGPAIPSRNAGNASGGANSG